MGCPGEVADCIDLLAGLIGLFGAFIFAGDITGDELAGGLDGVALGPVKLFGAFLRESAGDGLG